MTLLKGVEEALKDLDELPEHSPVIQQYTEDMLSYMKYLWNVSDELLWLDLEDEYELVTLHISLNKLHYGCSCTAKALRNKQKEVWGMTPSGITAKLLKL